MVAVIMCDFISEVPPTLIQRFLSTPQSSEGVGSRLHNQDYLPQVSASLAARHKKLHVLAQSEFGGEHEGIPARTLKSSDTNLKTSHFLTADDEKFSLAKNKQDIVIQL